jgi:hypothetical protein
MIQRMAVLAANQVHLQTNAQLSDDLERQLVQVLGEIDWLVKPAGFFQNSE